MVTTGWSSPKDKEEIIEFIDYVFSKSARPHDFATLLPKLYGKDGDGAGHHFVVREDGKIMATVLAYPVELHVGSKTLMTLGVGSVSTHPRARGKGYMQLLMDAIDERAKELDAVCAVLGGNRQRYEYYGYYYGGYQMNAKLGPQNAKHALRDVDASRFALCQMTQEHAAQATALIEKQACYCARPQETLLEILRSWYNEPFVVLKDGQMVGFGTKRKNDGSCHVAELLLEDEADFPAVMKILAKEYGTVSMAAAPWQKERAAWLARVCGDFFIGWNNAYKVYQRERLKEALHALGGGDEDFVFDGFAISQPLFVAPADCV